MKLKCKLCSKKFDFDISKTRIINKDLEEQPLTKSDVKYLMKMIGYQPYCFNCDKVMQAIKSTMFNPTITQPTNISPLQ